MDSISDLKWRYATKKFDPTKSLTTEQLSLLKEAFNLTATSYGLQPVRLVVVTDERLKQEMVPACYGQSQVRDASAVLVLCGIDVTKDYIEDYFELVKKVRNTPEDILRPFKEQLIASFSGKTTQEIYSWVKNQAYIGLGNLMSVCAQHRIDSCPMEGFVPSRIDEILDLNNKGLQSMLLLPVGYRANDDMFASMDKVRRSLKEMIIEM